METRRVTICDQPHPSTRHIPFLRFLFVVLSGFALTNLAIVVLAQSVTATTSRPNPFLEYTDIFPGQPASALETRTFSCTNSYNYNLPAEQACNMEVSHSIFSRVEPLVADKVISQITFILRDDTLKIGDLMLFLGNPRFGVYPRKVFCFWNNFFVIISTTAKGDAAALRPVWSVTLTKAY